MTAREGGNGKKSSLNSLCRHAADSRPDGQHHGGQAANFQENQLMAQDIEGVGVIDAIYSKNCMSKLSHVFKY